MDLSVAVMVFFFPVIGLHILPVKGFVSGMSFTYYNIEFLFAVKCCLTLALIWVWNDISLFCLGDRRSLFDIVIGCLEGEKVVYVASVNVKDYEHFHG